MRTLMALIAIACGIGLALTYNIPSPLPIALGLAAVGFGLLATITSYGKVSEHEEDPNEEDHH